MKIDYKSSLLKDKDSTILIPVAIKESNKQSELYFECVASDEMQQIGVLRKRLSSVSFGEQSEKQSTGLTSLILCNNTIGTAVMVLPLVFANCGIINSLVVLLLVGSVQFVTCKLIILHMKDNEPDLPEITERLLGKKWKAVFVISSCLYEFLVGIVFMILMNNMLYLILIFIFDRLGFEGYAKKSENRYDVYSFQINAWIFLIPCYLSCFMKNLDYIAALSKLGIYVLCSYVIFLVYISFDNYFSGRLMENLDNISFVSPNIIEASGAYSLAFFIHNNVCPLIKNMEKKEEAIKSVGISYVLSSIFYFLIGVIGYLGIIGRKTVDNHPQTIMDFFTQNSFFPFIIEILYFLKLLTVYPVFCYISRNQFFSLIYGQKKIEIRDDNRKKTEESRSIATFIYNTLYVGIAMACVLLNADLTFIMGLTGAVFGFLLVYIIPIRIHVKCYGINSFWPSRKKISNVEDGLEIIEKNRCNNHDDKNENYNCSRSLLYLMLIISVGLYCLIVQLIAFFQFRWLGS